MKSTHFNYALCANCALDTTISKEIYAFADTYLPDAMRNLAEAFDYAASACNIPVNDFGNAFLASGLAAGLSQSELATRSSVNIRNIQQYEQRAKDINRAAAISLQSLARALGCRIESMLKPDIPPLNPQLVKG